MSGLETTIASTCWECSTACGALVSVRDGKVVKVGPNAAHPHSRGAFCVKGIRALPESTYQDSRLRYPLRRIGARGAGGWARISWDAALDEMADRLADVRARHGPLALAGAVSGAYFSRGAIVALLLRSLGSPNWMINQDLCGGCRAVSDLITGLAIGGAADLDHTNCALLVGRNPAAADPVQWSALKRAKQRGAAIVVIDPLRTQAADLADLWLRPRPGTDAAIGLAMIHALVRDGRYDKDFVARWCHGFDALAARAASFPAERAAELSGVPAADIERAAALYADGPSTFASGHGIDAFSAGVQTFRAFHCLVAISGNLDRAGGNRRVKRPRGFRTYHDLLHDPAFRLPIEVERQTIGAERFPLWAGPDGWQTACHNPSVIEAMLTGKPYKVRALYASGVNIAVTYPDTRRTVEALRGLDFFAVAAHGMNPTAALADIVLPKTTALEEEEISLAPGTRCVNYTAPAVAPQGEARSDLAIARGLIDRLQARGALAGDFLPWPDQRAFNRFLLGDSAIDFEALRAVGYAEFPYELGNFAAQGFKTPTGKLELWSERLAALGLDPLPDYAPPRREREPAAVRERFPLTLQTGLREKTYHHSRFREQAWARKVSPDPLLRIHPETAARHSIGDGDWVTVETSSGQGACRMRAEITDRAPLDVLIAGMGWWRPEAAGPEFGALDVNVNAALSYGGPWDPITGSPDSRGLPCRLRRA